MGLIYPTESNRMPQGYDVIGDIHGMVEPLIRLLEKLGYRRERHDTPYQHPDGRKAIFVGDFIDRGLNGFDVVELAKSMTVTGNAISVMGNHELNAIFFHDDRMLREHSAKNINQHQAFLYQVAMRKDGYEKRKEIIDWFKTLPLYYENNELRVVHACWDNTTKSKLDEILDDQKRLPEDQYLNAATEGNEVFKVVEKWLKGDEFPLPPDVFFFDKGGIKRFEARLQWWLDETAGLEDLALLQGKKELIAENRKKLKGKSTENRVIYKDQKPVFVGHYWMNGELDVQTPYVCCVDYSVGREDKLCAYRWNGEQVLKKENMISVSASKRQ